MGCSPASQTSGRCTSSLRWAESRETLKTSGKTHTQAGREEVKIRPSTSNHEPSKKPVILRGSKESIRACEYQMERLGGVYQRWRGWEESIRGWESRGSSERPHLEMRPGCLQRWLILFWVELRPGGVRRRRQCSEHVHRKLE